MNRNQVNATLFGSEIRGQILQFFYERVGFRFQQSEVEKAINSPQGRLSRLLREYSDAGILIRNEERNHILYEAPVDDPRFASLSTFFQQESALVLALRKALKPFKEIEYACIFGSFARGTIHKDSDVDVIVFANSTDNQFAILSSIGGVDNKFRIPINPIYTSLTAWKQKLEQGEPVALSILSNPRITLKGKDPHSNSSKVD